MVSCGLLGPLLAEPRLVQENQQIAEEEQSRHTELKAGGGGGRSQADSGGAWPLLRETLGSSDS